MPVSPIPIKTKKLRPARRSAWLRRWLANHTGVVLNQMPGRTKNVTRFASITNATGAAEFWGIGETPQEAMNKLEEVLKREAPNA